MSAAIEIPYNSMERPDTGLYNAKLGVWLFLASEVMLFGALFSTYVLLRTGAETWEHAAEFLNVPLATINTLVLIISSVTMVMSWASLKLKDFGKYKLYMGLTILCGVAFLVIKGFEYAAKFEHHLLPSASTFMAIYFTMTGLHGLHVVGGMIVNGYLWGPGSKMWRTEPERFTNRIEVAGLYWHFVDLVWIFLFPTLYLLPGK
jgi:heme/copper-type cytochrome/quinol oxidase subunit 3